jgi:ubiquinone/menaquinone biosynthesis C-methylase UbiE
MPDLYTTIAEIPEDVQQALGDALVVRANDPQMRDIRLRYFGWLGVPAGGRAIDIGCGTGEVVRDLLEETTIGEAVGVDPSPVLIEMANSRFGGMAGLAFAVGDARRLDFGDGSFDLAVFHTSLCHIPEPDDALQEALRILKPGGTLAVFDGDYAMNTTALGLNDPLQACVEHTSRNMIHDVWLCRTLPARMRRAGFEVVRRDAHPYLAEGEAPYFLSLIERGADFMKRDGIVTDARAAGLKLEARTRIADGTFHGFICFNSVIARKPG